jgi:hypothetical protein
MDLEADSRKPKVTKGREYAAWDTFYPVFPVDFEQLRLILFCPGRTCNHTPVNTRMLGMFMYHRVGYYFG